MYICPRIAKVGRLLLSEQDGIRGRYVNAALSRYETTGECKIVTEVGQGPVTTAEVAARSDIIMMK